MLQDNECPEGGAVQQPRFTPLHVPSLGTARLKEGVEVGARTIRSTPYDDLCRLGGGSPPGCGPGRGVRLSRKHGKHRISPGFRILYLLARSPTSVLRGHGRWGRLGSYHFDYTIRPICIIDPHLLEDTLGQRRWRQRGVPLVDSSTTDPKSSLRVIS